MADNDDQRRKFADLVKLNGLSSKLIDRSTERRLLEEGVVNCGMSLDEARGTLRSVAEDNDLVFESETGKRVQQILDRHGGRSGKISKKQFDQTAAILRDFSNGAIGEEEARRQVKRIMVDQGLRPRRAGLLQTRGWFKSVEV